MRNDLLRDCSLMTVPGNILVLKPNAAQRLQSLPLLDEIEETNGIECDDRTKRKPPIGVEH